MDKSIDLYKNLIADIGKTYQQAKNNAIRSVHSELVKGYWQIGRQIVEYEQKGNIKADYGEKLIYQLSADLKQQYGKGFSASNLVYMRLIYFKYPKISDLSLQLTWSHYFELLKLSDDIERKFYENQTIAEKWSVRELKRQKKSALFQRLATGKNKNEILELSRKGHSINNEHDLVKDPYVLEFLDIPENSGYTETHLEQRIIDNLQNFLLELGSGFSFVGRQYRITVNNRHFYVDLVFYNFKLKCFVLIDLKVDEVEHHDLGQMNMYLGYFVHEMNDKNDNEPIGIILTKDKDEILVKYAKHGITNNLFVSKYQLYLPDKDLLQEQINKILSD